MTRQVAVRLGFLLIALIASALFLYSPKITAGQQVRQEVEVQLQAPTLQDVLNQLFGTPGMPGLLSGNQPFEFRAGNLMLTPQQAQNFFVPVSPTGMDFAALVAAVERLPGAEVKIEGFVNGAPFEFKVEAGEVKFEGLVLTQAQLSSLLDRLLMIPGIREVKIEALVNGQPVEVKIENKAREIEKLKNGAHAEHARHEARGRDRERQQRERMQAEHAEKRGDRARMEQPARIDKAGRVGMTERIRRPERVERVERVERIERPERIERIERPEHH